MTKHTPFSVYRYRKSRVAFAVVLRWRAAVVVVVAVGCIKRSENAFQRFSHAMHSMYVYAIIIICTYACSCRHPSPAWWATSWHRLSPSSPTFDPIQEKRYKQDMLSVVPPVDVGVTKTKHITVSTDTGNRCFSLPFSDFPSYVCPMIRPSWLVKWKKLGPLKTSKLSGWTFRTKKVYYLYRATVGDWCRCPHSSVIWK